MSQPLRQHENVLKRRTTMMKIKSPIKYDTTNVVNVSKIQSSQQHIQILSKGLKFVSIPRSINTLTDIVNCEKSLF